MAAVIVPIRGCPGIHVYLFTCSLRARRIGYGDLLLVLDIKLRVVDDFEHGYLRCLMWTSIWIGSHIRVKLCGGMILRDRFVCFGSTMCDGFSALCCGSTGELAVQLSHLSHFP